MLKKFIYILLLLISVNTFATHSMSGEITYVHISGTTYKFSVTTFTKNSSPADRPLIEIDWGDGAPNDSIQRISELILGNNDIKKNIYEGTHTFPTINAIFYSISVEDPNRIPNIMNIPNSVNTVFYLKTELFISTIFGFNNSSPHFDECAIALACVGELFTFNSRGVDTDGDSLYYTLQPSLRNGGQPILGYFFPQASNNFTINNFTGLVTWDAPINQGEYNFGVLVEEYRNGIKIGGVFRDIQIIVVAVCGPGFPPLICNNTVDVAFIKDERLELISYPNPTTGKFILKPFKKENNFSFLITNALGKKINPRMTFRENSLELDLRPYPKGVYFISSFIEEKKIIQKIIKH